MTVTEQHIEDPYVPEEPNPFHDNGAGPPVSTRNRTIDGGAFAFDEPSDVPALWGKGQEVIWAAGEGLMLCGPDGVGKTALQQQLILARIGLRTDLLGFPVPHATGRILYIAADRPRQAARSLRRMVAETDRPDLEERLLVWKGPLPFDIATWPEKLPALIHELGCTEVFIDSLKDVALKIADDETGARVNTSFQHTIAAGIELCVSHHQRKEQAASKHVGKPTRLADVYGSRWLTAGMGSVILLWGEPGDIVVDFSHLKQPAEDVGPFKLKHDHARGLTVPFETIDLIWLIDSTFGGLTAKQAAERIFNTDKLRSSDIEKARRRLERLVAEGSCYRGPESADGVHYMTRRA